MKFESGDKEFLLSRNFDRYGKNETLVCLEDAEELSVKDGDLQMLMGDLSPQIYDDTMAMAQMRVKPGMTPVSYTHLDVYKRQNTFCSSIIIFPDMISSAGQP